MPKKLYSVRKTRHILQSSYSLYKKKGKKLPPQLKSELEENLLKLEAAINNEDPETADTLARNLEAFSQQHLKKSFWDYAFELGIALFLALVIATLVRQMWFELYEIPTGSMRPTFREQDHLTVSKLPFGINYPLETKHLYFDPSLVQRTGIVIFSGDQIPLIDSNTYYFGIIPYKKRYIKRCIGKPGDILYFYGGQIYGMTKEGEPIPELITCSWMQDLEFIPFLSFEGRMSMPSSNTIIFKQMQIPVGKLSVNQGALVGEVFDGKRWVKDKPEALKTPHNQVQTYSDLWGMRNYAMARLLTKEQLQFESEVDLSTLEDGVLYLELRHTPNLTFPKPKFQQEQRGLNVMLNPEISIIPLQQHHLDEIMKNMYTARFVIKDGLATRYSVEGSQFGPTSPQFSNVPDGTYEFYFGRASKINWGGISTSVPDDSPLYKHSPENIQKLFNLGIEMDLAYAPRAQQQNYFPRRYAYFLNGDLYLLGESILKKNDPVLIAFNEREKKREEESSEKRPYIAFKDFGPPLNSEGVIDKDFIRTFGVQIPEGQYLVLGDNHAMSADSREFGFVPQNNLQGAPSLIIWPPGNRLGPPPQQPYNIINTPRMIIWGVVALIALIWYLIHQRNLRRPIKIER